MKKLALLALLLSTLTFASYSPNTIITDPVTSANQATVKAASTAPVATDSALVVEVPLGEGGEFAKAWAEGPVPPAWAKPVQKQPTAPSKQ